MKSVHDEVLPIAQNTGKAQSKTAVGIPPTTNGTTNVAGSHNRPTSKPIALPPKGAVKKPPACKKRARKPRKANNKAPNATNKNSRPEANASMAANLRVETGNETIPGSQTVQMEQGGCSFMEMEQFLDSNMGGNINSSFPANLLMESWILGDVKGKNSFSGGADKEMFLSAIDLGVAS